MTFPSCYASSEEASVDDDAVAAATQIPSADAAGPADVFAPAIVHTILLSQYCYRNNIHVQRHTNCYLVIITVQHFCLLL